ncbi:YolD-like family protein [Bacillus sp. PS06]|uniref:YolD-like family protein n=1 Tax=Bacillus sp. PS06 TaxID=2764176 RepID=UPI00178253EE|nr:YolD-like family protein [Bacillus sp. PS06]MBD8069419.1 YolD-like family protein [Bacillus sp. PS06]
MIKDRGKIKWGAAFMLPEMSSIQSRVDWDNKKVEKPLLDEDQLDEMNQTINYAVEYNLEQTYTIYDNGEYKLLMGKVHDIDEINKHLRIIDKFGELHVVNYEDIVKVLVAE